MNFGCWEMREFRVTRSLPSRGTLLTSAKFYETFAKSQKSDDSNDNLFYLLKAMLVGNGAKLDDIFLSPSLIGDIRREVHTETGAAIKVNIVGSQYKSYIGTCNIWLSLSLP